MLTDNMLGPELWNQERYSISGKMKDLVCMIFATIKKDISVPPNSDKMTHSLIHW